MIAAGDLAHPGAILSSWTFDPLLLGLLALASVGFEAGARRAARTGRRVSRRRRVCFHLGVAVLAVALLSPVDAYSGVLLSVHMVQHLLLTMVAPPLLLLGAPVTLALQALSPPARRRVAVPVLRSRVLNAVGNPVLGWGAFAVVLWGSHFSSVYELALEHHWIHVLEHGAYLLTALLFWWPVIAADASRHRLSEPARILYLFLAMPQTTFLGLALYGADRVLYPFYVGASARIGVSALADQHLAGALMWVSSMVLFLPLLGLVLMEWLNHEEQAGRRADERLDRAAASS